MALEVTRTIASVGAWIEGSGTESTRTSRLPCQVSAFMRTPYPAPVPPKARQTVARRPAEDAKTESAEEAGASAGWASRGPMTPAEDGLQRPQTVAGASCG